MNDDLIDQRMHTPPSHADLESINNLGGRIQALNTARLEDRTALRHSISLLADTAGSQGALLWDTRRTLQLLILAYLVHLAGHVVAWAVDRWRYR